MTQNVQKTERGGVDTHVLICSACVWSIMTCGIELSLMQQLHRGLPAAGFIEVAAEMVTWLIVWGTVP